MTDLNYRISELWEKKPETGTSVISLLGFWNRWSVNHEWKPMDWLHDWRYTGKLLEELAKVCAVDIYSDCIVWRDDLGVCGKVRHDHDIKFGICSAWVAVFGG